VENTEFTSAEKARMSRSQFKTMLCVSSITRDSSLWIHCRRKNANQQCYLEVLTRLRESVVRKRPELYSDNWIIHHGNAPAHDALRIREFWAKKFITKTDRPPYSPELAPWDFWLFPKLKNALKGQRFSDIPDIQRNVTTLLRGIPENDFQDCFQQWHHRLTST
jgi:transposase